MRILALLGLLAVAASGQTGPEILKKTAETYQSLKSYHFESQIVTESVSESNESRTRGSRITAAMLPDRRRSRGTGPRRTIKEWRVYFCLMIAATACIRSASAGFFAFAASFSRF